MRAQKFEIALQDSAAWLPQATIMPDVPRDQTWATRMAKRSKIVRYNGTICSKCGTIIRMRDKDAHAVVCKGKSQRFLTVKEPFVPRYRFNVPPGPDNAPPIKLVKSIRVPAPADENVKQRQRMVAFARQWDEYLRSTGDWKRLLGRRIVRLLARIKRHGTGGIDTIALRSIEAASRIFDHSDVEAPEQKRAANASPNYTPAELATYLGALRTGLALGRGPFRQKLIETNFTSEDRQKIGEARRLRRRARRRNG